MPLPLISQGNQYLTPKGHYKGIGTTYGPYPEQLGIPYTNSSSLDLSAYASQFPTAPYYESGSPANYPAGYLTPNTFSSWLSQNGLLLALGVIGGLMLFSRSR